MTLKVHFIKYFGIWRFKQYWFY